MVRVSIKQLVAALIGLFFCALQANGCSGSTQALRTQGDQACSVESECIDACDLGDNEACSNLGRLYETERRYDEAEDAYERGCQREDLRCCVALSQVLRSQGREGEARSIFREHCDTEEDAELCRSFGELMFAEDESSEESLLIFRERCEQDDGIACRYVGRSHQREGEEGQALTFLDRSCELGDLEGCLMLSEMLSGLGRERESQEARARANELGREKGGKTFRKRSFSEAKPC